MEKGDLVRVWCINEDDDLTGKKGWNAVAIVLKYESWEKIATVVLQGSGEIKRIAARDLELLKRSPENIRRLCDLYREKKKKT